MVGIAAFEVCLNNRNDDNRFDIIGAIFTIIVGSGWLGWKEAGLLCQLLIVSHYVFSPVIYLLIQHYRLAFYESRLSMIQYLNCVQ
jgi:hypothetical protein